jgi:hypothetical protein
LDRRPAPFDEQQLRSQHSSSPKAAAAAHRQTSWLGAVPFGSRSRAKKLVSVPLTETISVFLCFFTIFLIFGDFS